MPLAKKSSLQINEFQDADYARALNYILIALVIITLRLFSS
jgi:hypothetical protein